MLGVPFHPPPPAHACHDKYLARQLFQAAGCACPAFFRATLDDDSARLAARAPYPCVLKPLGLSASRGVIRADDPAGVRRRVRPHPQDRRALFAGGKLHPRPRVRRRRSGHRRAASSALAIFDKPDPLEGPYFEETIYVTPSRDSAARATGDILDTTARACQLSGCSHGPVHAELRYNAEGAWMLEAHARPIGGLCAQARCAWRAACRWKRLILRARLGEDVLALEREPRQARRGHDDPHPQRRNVRIGGRSGTSAARSPESRMSIVTAKAGQRLVPLPEGSSYLGFIFARGETPGEVESCLAAVPRGTALPHRHRARDLQAFVLGGTKSGGRAAPSPKK